MTRIPPLLPEEVLLRVMRIARLDGMGILAISGFLALLSAVAGDRVGAIVGLLIAGAGALELHGAGLLMAGESRGVRWLIGSQLFLLIVILAFCQYQLVNMNLDEIKAAMTDAMKTQLEASGQPIDVVLTSGYKAFFRLVAALSIGYQGGMILYYYTRRRAVARALEEN